MLRSGLGSQIEKKPLFLIAKIDVQMNIKVVTIYFKVQI
jgi:hypothetical protein